MFFNENRLQLTVLTVALMLRGVSSCSSLGWPAGWPHLHLGAKNSGWHNAWLSGVIWHQLRDRNAVNTAIMPRTLLSCNQFYRGAAGGPELLHVPPPWPPLRTASVRAHRENNMLFSILFGDAI